MRVRVDSVKQVLKPQVPDLSKLNDIGDLFGAGTIVSAPTPPPFLVNNFD